MATLSDNATVAVLSQAGLYPNDNATSTEAFINPTNFSDEEYLRLQRECPQENESQQELSEQVSFWIEGVSQTFFCILGIFGNIVASIILSRKEMRNAFNLLLVTMAIFDSTFLFGSILESFRKQFRLVSDLHKLLFPYLLYPFNQIAITASIFMTVAIALERYFAVHYPLDYSQAMHEANALTKRIFHYVASVTCLAVLFTASRFLEAEIVYNHIRDPVTNVTIDYKLELKPTALRTAPLYTTYFNWSRLLVLGIIPFAMLVYLNTRIYQDIKARRNRRMNQRHQQQKKRLGFQVPTFLLNGRERNEVRQQKRCRPKKKGNLTNKDEPSPQMPLQSPQVVIVQDDEETIEMDERSALADAGDGGGGGGGGGGGHAPVTTVVKPLKQSAAATTTTTPLPPPINRHVTVNESRSKKEDNLAAIFMGFIMVFLICHLPRLLLNIHELFTIEFAMRCLKAKLAAFPVWSQVAVSFSSLMLVLNSATNILIYCALSSKFREEFRKVFRRF